MCFFTPILVVVLSALGLSGLIGVLDHVLLPTLAIFSGDNRTGSMETQDNSVELISVITCPECSHVESETMPTNACQWFYDCKGCGVLLKPKTGDC